MGDLIFIIKMFVFTMILILIMQVQVGQTTLETKVIQLTHNSQFSKVIQKVAIGASTFLSNQYANVTKNINIPFFKKDSASQKPGERLKIKIQEIKASLNEKWPSEKSMDPNVIEEYTDELED